MSGRIRRTEKLQMDPTFINGYPYERRYHNLGQLMTPYEGKPFGVVGDYGPVQTKPYYTPWQLSYPYVMDSQFRASSYIPTAGNCYGCGSTGGLSGSSYSPCYNPQYPDFFVAPNYFVSDPYMPSGHELPARKNQVHLNAGLMGEYKSEEQLKKQGAKLINFANGISQTEDYTPLQVPGGYGYGNGDSSIQQSINYKKLPVAVRSLTGTKDFPPRYNRFYN